MVQGLVNSFGPTVMAAFAAAVKIDAFAYMPVQDFGNAYSTFAAQNFGAKREIASARASAARVLAQRVAFGAALSHAAVCALAAPLMLPVRGARPKPPSSRSGVRYLRIEGALLRRNRLPVPALRPISAPSGSPSVVGGADGDFAGHARACWPICCPRSVGDGRRLAVPFPSAGFSPTLPGCGS